MRTLHPAPVRLSVRADPLDPRRFYLRLPKAAEAGAPPMDRRWPWLESYLGRRLATGIAPVPVHVSRERYIRLRAGGHDVEFAILLPEEE